MARSSPYASISRRNRAIRDAWRANLAIKAPFSRRGPRNHTWREDVASAARPFAAPRRGSRVRELAERALCPAARAWSACRMRGSLPSRTSCRYSRLGPATHRCHSHVRAATHRCRYSRGRIHRRCPSRRARRAHHATRIAHRSRGAADRALPAPPRRPCAAHALAPPPHPSRLLLAHPRPTAPPRGSRCGSGNSREMVR